MFLIKMYTYSFNYIKRHRKLNHPQLENTSLLFFYLNPIVRSYPSLTNANAVAVDYAKFYSVDTTTTILCWCKSSTVATV